MLRLLRLPFKILGALCVAVVLYYLVTLLQVWLTSRQYDAHAAGAIVVMGAAQYDGVPSPDLQARLNEALLLERQGYAHLIAVTGNKQTGDQFTEAQASERYLQLHGISPADIVEAGGDDTWQNLADAAPLLKARHATTVLVVTDPFHEDRSMAVASDVGLRPSPTPTQTSPISGWSTVPYFLKEALGVSIGRIVGYQHLHALG